MKAHRREYISDQKISWLISVYLVFSLLCICIAFDDAWADEKPAGALPFPRTNTRSMAGERKSVIPREKKEAVPDSCIRW